MSWRRGCGVEGTAPVSLALPSLPGWLIEQLIAAKGAQRPPQFFIGRMRVARSRLGPAVAVAGRIIGEIGVFLIKSEPNAIPHPPPAPSPASCPPSR